jgi:AcrR family transcriptional regulator
MSRVNIPNAKDRILEAALKIFAEKSFEGARIEEIAKAANVPKSLIYYHFESKDKIFEVLTENFIKEYTSLIETAKEDEKEGKIEGLMDRMKNIYYDFGQRNADLVRVMFIDSLKKSKEEPILFKVVEAMISLEEKELAGTDEYDVQERLIVEFFTNFIPNYAYICFADSWTKYFKIDRKNFNKLYMKAYMGTHVTYHGYK